MAKRKPKNNNITWTPQQRKQLTNLVRNYNKKIYDAIRKAKKTGTLKQTMENIPSPLSTATLKKHIKTRDDFLAIQKMYKGMTQAKVMDTNREGQNTFLLNTAKRLQKKRQAQTSEIMEKFDPMKGNTQRLRDEGIAYRDSDLAKKTNKQLERFIDVQLRSLSDAGQYDKDEQYRKNFLTRVHEMEGINDAQRRILENFLRTVDPSYLRKLWYDSNYLHIGYLYPAPGQEYDHAADMIRELNEFIEGWEAEGEKWYVAKGSTSVKPQERGKLKDASPIRRLLNYNPIINTKQGVRYTYPSRKK